MKTTVYLNEAAEERFKKIKAINPTYSLSEATDAGLKLEEAKVDTQLTGMVDQIAKKGDMFNGDFYGTKAKFIGRVLADTPTGQVGSDEVEHQTLYITKKGQYLIQKTVCCTVSGNEKYEYEVCPTVQDLQQKASPNLLTKAGKTEGELLEDLDI